MKMVVDKNQHTTVRIKKSTKKDLEIFSNGIFDINSGITTVSDICASLEKSNIVIIDTSSFSGETEVFHHWTYFRSAFLSDPEYRRQYFRLRA